MGTIVCADNLEATTALPDGFANLIYIDPPFDSGLAVQTLGKLQRGGVMAPGGLVYVEAAAQLPELVMQPPFELVREKVLGQVRLRLFRHA